MSQAEALRFRLCFCGIASAWTCSRKNTLGTRSRSWELLGRQGRSWQQGISRNLMGKTWAFPQPIPGLGIGAGKRLVKVSSAAFKPESPAPLYSTLLLVSKRLKDMKGNSLLPSPPPPHILMGRQINLPISKSFK